MDEARPVIQCALKPGLAVRGVAARHHGIWLAGFLRMQCSGRGLCQPRQQGTSWRQGLPSTVQMPDRMGSPWSDMHETWQPGSSQAHGRAHWVTRAHLVLEGPGCQAGDDVGVLEAQGQRHFPGGSIRGASDGAVPVRWDDLQVQGRTDWGSLTDWCGEQSGLVHLSVAQSDGVQQVASAPPVPGKHVLCMVCTCRGGRHGSENVLGWPVWPTHCWTANRRGDHRRRPGGCCAELVLLSKCC